MFAAGATGNIEFATAMRKCYDDTTKFEEQERKSIAAGLTFCTAEADLIPLGDRKGDYLLLAVDNYTGHGFVFYQPTKSAADCCRSMTKLNCPTLPRRHGHACTAFVTSVVIQTNRSSRRQKCLKTSSKASRCDMPAQRSMRESSRTSTRLSKVTPYITIFGTNAADRNVETERINWEDFNFFYEDEGKVINKKFKQGQLVTNQNSEKRQKTASQKKKKKTTKICLRVNAAQAQASELLDKRIEIVGPNDIAVLMSYIRTHRFDERNGRFLFKLHGAKYAVAIHTRCTR